MFQAWFVAGEPEGLSFGEPPFEDPVVPPTVWANPLPVLGRGFVGCVAVLNLHCVMTS
jgi:hypothetical protein